MKALALWGLLLLGTVSASAEDVRCLPLFSIFKIEAPQVRDLTFKEVDIFRRNNNIGVQLRGNLEFKRWVDVIPPTRELENTIGLTARGQIYHVVRTPDRKIARLLSGHQQFKDLFYSSSGVLVAIDSHNTVHLYSPEAWMQSPVGRLLKRGAILWTTSTAAIVGVVGTLYPETLNYPFPLGATESFYIPLIPVMTAFTNLMTTAFPMMQHYEELNTYPNGFVATNVRYTNLERLQQSLYNSELNGDLFRSHEHFQAPDLKALPPAQPKETTEPLAHDM